MKNKLLLLFIGIIALAISCKKDDDNTALLTSGKWHYAFMSNLHNVGRGTDGCHYIEFNPDGTFSGSRLGDGTYALSDDGKSLTIILTANIKDEYSQWKGTIHLLKENYLRITIIAVREMNQDYGYEITLEQKNRCNQ